MSSRLVQALPALCLSWVLVACLLVNGWTSKLESQSTVPGPRSTAQDRRLPVEPQTLNPGEKHTYPLMLKANDFLKLVVEQRGIDVVVRLLGPDEKVIQEVNSPNGTQGPELLSLIVEQAGTYTLEIVSLEKTVQAGKYELKLEALHTAQEQDRAQVEIEKLDAEAEKLRQAGKYNQALPLAQQALEKSEKIFGPEHLLVAQCLNSLAMLYRAKGDYSMAELLQQRSLTIREKTLGPDHPSVATSLNHLGSIYYFKSDYARAEPLYQRSLAIREKVLGPNHLNVANSINDLAVLYLVKGDYSRAEPLYLRSLAIYEKTLGPHHSYVATSLNNLAGLYKAKGNYAQAEPLYLRSLAIWENALGPDHPNVATSLSSLAVFYKEKGDFTRAEPLYLRSLAIFEKALSSDHPDVATSLNNLARFYQEKGDYAKAEPLLQRSLAISEKAYSPNHPSVATSLNNLAGLYRDTGDYSRAELMYQRSLSIREKVLSPDHPNVATSLSNLAGLYRDAGDYSRAEPMYQRALSIREKALGPDHPEVAQSLNNLAGLYWAKGETTQAVQYLTRRNDTTERDLMRNLVAGSEHQKALYLRKTAGQVDQSISLHVQESPQDQTALQVALTVILRRKGRSLDAMTGAIETLRQRQTPETQKLLDNYASLAGQLSVLTLRGPGTRKLGDHLAYLKELEQQKEQLEVEISAKSAEFKAQVTPITLENVQHQIPPQASLVEYAVYRPFDAKTRQYGNPRYVAYVLKSPKSEVQGSGFGVQGIKSASLQNPEPQNLNPGVKTPNPEPRTLSFVDLGEAEAIDQAVMALRQVLKTPSNKLNTEVKLRSQALYKLVVKPIEALVGKTSHLLISPDGALNLIPFSALANDQSQYLVEKYTLTYLTSGRDLLRLGVKLGSQDPPLVIADPDYATGEGPHLLGQPFPPLQRLIGTHTEGEKLKEIFPTAQLKVKGEASETVLKQVNRPELVHIATHGYFLKDAAEESSDKQGTRLLDRSEAPPINLEKLRANNPLLRSWLFFAGANRGGNEDNDGIMTALEAAQLNLWGTKLVTLSACETGVGETKNGDGVYGLRRALVLAGSEAQMMSLWSVSDQATRELMVKYYTRLKAFEGRSEALRNVQLEMLKNPRRQHPFYWASFIQSGEWANLDGKR